jgi:hypothetical protein
VSTQKQDSGLVVDLFTADANGNFTDTHADVTSGFSFVIDPHRSMASTSGSGLPATTCTYDPSFNLIGCTSKTIDVAVNWTGQGPLTRAVIAAHSKTDGLSVATHVNGTSRYASATGTITGATVDPSQLQIGLLGSTKELDITRCFGLGC